MCLGLVLGSGSCVCLYYLVSIDVIMVGISIHGGGWTHSSTRTGLEWNMLISGL